MSRRSAVADEEEAALAKRRRVLVGAAVVGVLVLGVAGYLIWGRGAAVAPSADADPDRFQLEQLVERFEDVASNANAMKNNFAADAVPKGAAAKAYQKYAYRPAKPPEVAGSTATMRVSVTDPKTGGEVGQQDWTFVKDGDKWKVKTAPLP